MPDPATQALVTRMAELDEKATPTWKGANIMDAGYCVRLDREAFLSCTPRIATFTEDRRVQLNACIDLIVEMHDALPSLLAAIAERDAEIARIHESTVTEDEQKRWQDEIRDKCLEVADRIDGCGCDSGDPLDVSLTEIGQAFAFLQDRIAELESKLKGTTT